MIPIGLHIYERDSLCLDYAGIDAHYMCISAAELVLVAEQVKRDEVSAALHQ